MSRAKAVVGHGVRYVTSYLPLKQRRRLWYLAKHHRVGNFENPTYFTEKVNWRILNDRRPDLAWTCDKLAMKDFAEANGVPTPKTLWVGTDLAEFAGQSLPERWVLKGNHRSQTVFLGSGRPDPSHLREVTRSWLGQFDADRLGEWAYSQAKPVLFAEEWIGGDEAPPDYKFFVFDGEVVCAQVDTNRFSGHQRAYVDADWQRLRVENVKPAAPDSVAPEHLPQMKEYAARLGRNFDFMRIDLYDTPQGVFLGETTPYPGGGLDRYVPGSFDAWLGSKWKLPTDVSATARVRVDRARPGSARVRLASQRPTSRRRTTAR